jgi:hypothetical protein
MGTRDDRPDDARARLSNSALALRPSASRDRTTRDEPPRAQAGREPRANGWATSFDGLQGVWLRLGDEWTSVAVLSADPDVSTSAISRALTDLGSRLSGRPIEFMAALDVDADRVSSLVGHLGAVAEAWTPSATPFASASWRRPITKTIVALESPMANPLALPVALAADGIVLCVQRGRTQLDAIRNTIAAVGAERILCCVVID